MATSQILNKRKLIRENSAGKTFVDIGGLWGTKGETVTNAIEGGASRATMADIQPLGNEWWTAFDEHCAARDITEYGKVRADICSPDAPSVLGTYDFVHCAGIMYHVADLFAFIGNLRAVTRDYLMIGSVVMPETIDNAKGTLEFGPDHAYLTPVLSEQNRDIVAEYLRNDGRKAWGLTDDAPFFDGIRPKTGPWWWLYSGAFMSRIISAHGMEILAEGYTPSRQAYTVFARVAGA